MNQSERDRAHQTYANLVCQERLVLDHEIYDAKKTLLPHMNQVQYVEARHEMEAQSQFTLEQLEAYDKFVDPIYKEYVRKTANHFQFYVEMLNS